MKKEILVLLVFIFCSFSYADSDIVKLVKLIKNDKTVDIEAPKDTYVEIKRMLSLNPDLVDSSYTDSSDIMFYGHTPLHIATFWKKYLIIALLIENGANVNSKVKGKVVTYGKNQFYTDRHGWTPLHIAISRCSSKLFIMTFLMKGADINAVIHNMRGYMTPLDVAIYSWKKFDCEGYGDVVSFLKTYGAKKAKELGYD